MNEEFIYFDKTNPMLKTIRSYIVSQCQTICRNDIHEDTVKREFLDFDFGYVD